MLLLAGPWRDQLPQGGPRTSEPPRDRLPIGEFFPDGLRSNRLHSGVPLQFWPDLLLHPAILPKLVHPVDTQVASSAALLLAGPRHASPTLYALVGLHRSNPQARAYSHVSPATTPHQRD